MKKYPSVSAYCYVLDNPIKFTDPTGRDVNQNDAFKNSKTNQGGFTLFNTSELGKSLLLKFASATGNLVTASTPGALSKHEIVFTKNTQGDYGNTDLKVWDESTKEFIPYDKSVAVDANTKFQIDVGIVIGITGSNADQGFAAGTIAHEVFTHLDDLSVILETFEASSKSPDDIKKLNADLQIWNEESTTKEQHDKLAKGDIVNYNTAVKQIRENLKTEISKSTTADEKKGKQKQLQGLKDEVESDVEGGFQTITEK
jgi:hypothetical protein